MATIYFLLLSLGVNCQNPPSTGLYFMLNNQIYLPKSSVNIRDIGSQPPSNRSLAGSTLVCVTTNVNKNCCRNRDDNNNGPIGTWHYPNNETVKSPKAAASNDNFTRYVYAQELRLSSLGTPEGPLGEYTCKIPLEDGVNVEAAGINIVNYVAVTSVSITQSSSSEANVTLVILTCSAGIVGRGIPSFMWFGTRRQGPKFGQNITENTFIDEFILGRMNDSNNGIYTCQVTLESSVVFSTIVLPVTGLATRGEYSIKIHECSNKDISHQISIEIFQLISKEFSVRLTGRLPFYPANSCDDIRQLYPDVESGGNYWITSEIGVAQMYCET